MAARWHENIFPVCEELKISFVAFSPLANGLFAGTYKNEKIEESDYRKKMPQFTESGLAKAQDAIDFLKKIADEKNCTPAQISLAWMLCEKNFIIPIPGSRKFERLKENFESGEIKLSAEEISKINAKLSTTNFEVFGGSKIVTK